MKKISYRRAKKIFNYILENLNEQNTIIFQIIYSSIYKGINEKWRLVGAIIDVSYLADHVHKNQKPIDGKYEITDNELDKIAKKWKLNRKYIDELIDIAIMLDL